MAAQKNAAPRPLGVSYHLSIICMGVQYGVPQICCAAEAEMMPIRAVRVLSSGIVGICQ